MLVYIDVKDREGNANIYENLSIGMEMTVSSEMPIIIMVDFNGHVGFLGSTPPRHLLGSHTVLGISVPGWVNFALFMAYSFSSKSSYS